MPSPLLPVPTGTPNFGVALAHHVLRTSCLQGLTVQVLRCVKYGASPFLRPSASVGTRDPAAQGGQ